MPDTAQPTYAEVVKEIIGAIGAVQDAHDTIAVSANDLLTAQEKFPPLEKAVAGKQGTLTTDTTKVGGIWSTSGYYYVTKNKIPAGGTWLIFYATSFPYTGDRAVGTSIDVVPGGFTLGKGLHAWWNLCIRIS